MNKSPDLNNLSDVSLSVKPDKDSQPVMEVTEKIDISHITPPTKNNIVLRQQLIIQNLLNNISLAIREGQPVELNIGYLEITKTEVKIENLTFSKIKGGING